MSLDILQTERIRPWATSPSFGEPCFEQSLGLMTIRCKPFCVLSRSSTVILLRPLSPMSFVSNMLHGYVYEDRAWAMGGHKNEGVHMPHTERKCAQHCFEGIAPPLLSFPAIAPSETVAQSSESKAKPFTRYAQCPSVKKNMS